MMEIDKHILVSSFLCIYFNSIVTTRRHNLGLPGSKLRGKIQPEPQYLGIHYPTYRGLLF